MSYPSSKQTDGGQNSILPEVAVPLLEVKSAVSVAQIERTALLCPTAV